MQAMVSYLLSLALGLLVGFIYRFFDARSLAPLIIALVGLLGILVGEQVLPHENSIKSVARALHLFDVMRAMTAKSEKGETDNAGGTGTQVTDRHKRGHAIVNFGNVRTSC